ncbi:isoquinoline 1-oxidoreductase [Maritimibacter sp. 55A14]|uniref:xanthine dehydrogenase family protein molybdopterin-binding subunit n=1 Tax=Maritimibacter sp. 55A14 TaxID=2174844 RepID=UPI000D60B8DB|nr:molybdopterin cofactor-binding domain-containing protein [Maritimibacter sp. 55A14]PWE34332.1 isoquinoline 1-oxidoreductase [Maritimibacter sp. 55A14]
MSKLGKITRRGFLVTAAAVAGGVAFMVWQDRKPVANPLAPEGDAVALNPWLVIDAEGVTIVTPRAEMGQGTQTTLAAMVAEELDLDWQDIRIMHGPASKSYYNGAILAAGLPFRDYARSGWKESVADATDVLGKLMGLQVTGGSTAMIDGFEKMRHAGAAARIVLTEAAARRLDLPASDLRTEAGHVVAPDGTRLAYTDLAADAAGIEPPRAPALRPAAEWRYLGRDMPRLDMEAKATGTAEFGIDVRLPDMVFATVRMTPHLGGGMKGFDATAARAMPGVIEVIDLGTGIAVVASNTWLAFQAAEAVEIDWGPAPYPASTAEQFDVIATALDEAPNSTLRGDGDVEAAPGTLVEAEYRAPWLAHATMEPMNATARMQDGRLEIWCGNQAPVITAEKCAAAVGLERAAVTVHTTFLGGGFGRRGETDFSTYAARIAAAMPGRPVKVTWTREEDMRHDFYRPAGVARFRGKVEGGTATALAGAIAAPSVTRQAGYRMAGIAAPGPDKSHVDGAFDQPYAIPNYRIDGHLADLDVPIGFWRSVGFSLNGFFHESFIDELAHAAGRDPLEFRLELIRPEHAPSAKVLEAVREMSGWTGNTPAGVGRGVAFCYSFGTAVAQVVEVRDSPDGIRIANAWIACDPGLALDPRNIRAQMTSGLIYGLSAAAYGEITFTGGRVDQGNFPDYEALRMHTAPAVEVRVLENNARMGGVGEPGTPPSMPALANALFDLTGTRARELPLSRSFDLMI